jgi:hypothetical protein
VFVGREVELDSVSYAPDASRVSRPHIVSIERDPGRPASAHAGSLGGGRHPSAALEDAIAAGVLARVPARIPEEVIFPRPLVRAGVDDDLSPSRRRELRSAEPRASEPSKFGTS